MSSCSTGVPRRHAQIGEHLEVRTTMSGLDARDVTDRHVCAGQVGLSHPLGDSRSAQSLTQLRRVDLPEQVSLTGIHVRQCDRTVANPVKNAISRGLPAQIAGLVQTSGCVLLNRFSATILSDSGVPRRANRPSFRVNSTDPPDQSPMARMGHIPGHFRRSGQGRGVPRSSG